MVKWVGDHHLDEMREKPNRNSAMLPGPGPAYNPRQTFVGTAIVAAMLLAAVFATAYPVAVVSIAVGAVIARKLVLTVRRLQQRRRREGRSRHVCIPMTGVCVEA
jgi:hypothetical protein